MVSVRRGEIWWAELPEPRGSEPGFRRPVLIIQADSFNESPIQTVLVAVITGNLRLGEAPGNVPARAAVTGLPRDSVINVSQILTLDRDFLIEPAGALTPQTRRAVEEGLRLILHVATRSIWLQPYFESGFPYGHNQWISAAGTSWAAMALSLAVEPQRLSQK